MAEEITEWTTGNIKVDSYNGKQNMEIRLK